MSRRAIAVFGAGGHAKVVVDLVLALGEHEIVPVDDDPAKLGGEILGFRIETRSADAARLRERGVEEATVAIGDNAKREEIGLLASRLGFRLPALVHPHATVSRYATLGEGTVVFAHAIVAADSSIGRWGIVNHGASVDHDCHLGDAVHVAPGVRLGGNVTIGRLTTVGLGARILPGRRVGAGSIVGAGACVVGDIPDGVVVAGVPARILRGR